ncbi:hypothetical protein NDU88_004337 [Pleurodeles waltl]|uniref:Uncharacterized protein n=1 Tax=Pleurodeles waltl TaxID=8319 RepID=A0AAV7PJI6_PLEWA|nr:hypothetical protein NDU88_004337 [Pleurodeles waltl]
MLRRGYCCRLDVTATPTLTISYPVGRNEPLEKTLGLNQVSKEEKTWDPNQASEEEKTQDLNKASEEEKTWDPNKVAEDETPEDKREKQSPGCEQSCLWLETHQRVSTGLKWNIESIKTTPVPATFQEERS